MSFYHVTNKLVIVELEAVQKVQTKQRLITRKIMRDIGAKEWLADDGGLHAIKVDNPKDWDSKLWCLFDKKTYGPKVLRPRASGNAAKPMRELFESVPKVHETSLNLSLNFRSPLFEKKASRRGHRTLLGVTHVKLKKDNRWILHIPEWAVSLVKFPDGIEEITRTQFEKWGGTVSE